MRAHVHAPPPGTTAVKKFALRLRWRRATGAWGVESVSELCALRQRVCVTSCRRDEAWGDWLARALEAWRIGKDLVGRWTPAGPVPATLAPVCCHRERGAAGDALCEQTVAALQESQFLIVLCSPAAARSQFLEAQIRFFQAMGRAARVIPVVIAGEPGVAHLECLPPALRFRHAQQRRWSAAHQWPIDLRPIDLRPIDLRPHRDGREGATRKIIAALLGLPLDEIAWRAERRRERTMCIRLAAAAALIALSLAVEAGVDRVRGELYRNDALLEASLARATTATAAAAAAAQRLGLPDRVSRIGLVEAERGLEALAAVGRDSARLRLSRATTRIALARVHAALGDADAARARANKAGALLARLADAAPDNAPWQRALSASFAALGNLLHEQGRDAQAQASYRASVALTERLVLPPPLAGESLPPTRSGGRGGGTKLASAAPAPPAYQLAAAGAGTLPSSEAGDIRLRTDLGALAARTLKLGDLDLAVGAHDDALGHYHESLAMAERLAAGEPHDAARQHGVALAHQRIGDALRENGELDEALASYQAGLALAERLTRAGDAEGERALAAAHLEVGDVLALQGQPAAALASYRMSHAIALRHADAGDAGWQDGLRLSHERIGAVLEAQGDLAGALAHYRTTLTLAARRARAGGGERELALAHGRVGDALRGLGDHRGALAAYQEKRGIIARLAGRDHAQWQHELGATHASVGFVHEARGDLAAAQKEYEALLAIGRRFAAADPDDPRLQRDLAVSHGKLAAVHHRRGKAKAALAELRRGRDIMAGLVAAAPEFAPWASDLAGFDALIAALEGRRVPQRVAGACEPACPGDAAAASGSPALDAGDRVAARPAASPRRSN